jgi:hypothetical protein
MFRARRCLISVISQSSELPRCYTWQEPDSFSSDLIYLKDIDNNRIDLHNSAINIDLLGCIGCEFFLPVCGAQKTMGGCHWVIDPVLYDVIKGENR